MKKEIDKTIQKGLKRGDKYYFVSSFGGPMHIETSEWMDYQRDWNRFKQGNISRTKKRCGDKLKKVLKALAQ